jgi:hypothetical protein
VSAQTPAASDAARGAGEGPITDPGVRRQAQAVRQRPAAIARGEEPPPSVAGDADLHRTPSGWQSLPKGVKPEDVGKHAISR